MYPLWIYPNCFPVHWVSVVRNQHNQAQGTEKMKKIILPRFAPIPTQKGEEKIEVKAVKKQPQTVNIKAADVLSDNHPLHQVFLNWLGDKPATKRKAREFCSLIKVMRAA